MPPSICANKNIFIYTFIKYFRENKIKKRLDHDLLYPDYPLKKEHIVFDVIKKNTTKKKFKSLYKVSNVESKIIKDIITIKHY